MAVNYVVQADVVDIRSDKPRPSDAFLVDTNVWLWMTYPRASADPSLPPHQKYYPAYFKRAMAARSRFYRCGLSLAELAHHIETAEREIFSLTNAGIKPKVYRHQHIAERARIVEKVYSAWKAIEQISHPMELTIDDASANSALDRFASLPLDGYDLLYVEAMNKAGVTQIVSDDGDFSAVPRIQVFTANHNVIHCAQTQGKLLTR